MVVVCIVMDAAQGHHRQKTREPGNYELCQQMSSYKTGGQMRGTVLVVLFGCVFTMNLLGLGLRLLYLF